jgi:hypothetical protein
MNKAYLFIISLIVLVSCEKPQPALSDQLKQRLDGKTAVIYQNILSDNWEQTRFPFKYYYGLSYSFELIDSRPGEYLASTGVLLYDINETNYVSIKYYLDDEDPYLGLRVYVDGEKDMDEVLVFMDGLDEIHLKWKTNQLIIESGELEQAIPLHFKPNTIALNNTAVEIISTIELLYDGS